MLTRLLSLFLLTVFMLTLLGSPVASREPSPPIEQQCGAYSETAFFCTRALGDLAAGEQRNVRFGGIEVCNGALVAPRLSAGLFGTLPDGMAVANRDVSLFHVGVFVINLSDETVADVRSTVTWICP